LQDQLDLFGDGRVTLIPLPGHTPGTTGLLAALERDAPMLLVSDAVALRHHYDQRLQPRNTWNVEQADRSLQEIRRIEASGATVIFGHDAQQADGLRKGQAHYD
jgi:glyoxylase-like metal-dependent hydrolase (beta-lactamase superfamily II)